MLPFGGTIEGTNESASTNIQVKSAVRFGVRATVGAETSLWCYCWHWKMPSRWQSSVAYTPDTDMLPRWLEGESGG